MSPHARDYARYAELIRKQIESLANDDHDALGALADERDVLADHITRHTDSADAQTRVLLEQCAALHDTFLASLATLRHAALRDLRASDERRPGLLAYGSTPPGHGAFDRRL